MTEEEVFVTDIDLDANVAIQTRVGMNPDALERYRYALKHEREDVPPVVLFQDEERRYWIGDGHHRCGAQLALNPEIPIQAIIHPGIADRGTNAELRKIMGSERNPSTEKKSP